MRAKFNYLCTLLSARVCRLYYKFFSVVSEASIIIIGFGFIVFYYALMFSITLFFITLPLFAILGFWALIFKLLA